MDCGAKAAVVRIRVGFRVGVTDLNEKTHTHRIMQLRSLAAF